MKTYYKSHNDTSIDNIADSSADNSDDNATVLPSKTLIIHLALGHTYKSSRMCVRLSGDPILLQGLSGNPKDVIINEN